MRWLRRHRGAVLVAVAALTLVLVSAWLGRHSRAYAADLDPGNPDPNDMRCLRLGGL